MSLFFGIFCPVDQAKLFGIEFADLIVRPLAYYFVEFGADRVNDHAGAGANAIFALGLTVGSPAGPVMHNGPVVVSRSGDDPVCFWHPVVIWFASWFNVFVMDSDVSITIPTLVLMEKTERMAKLMSR